MPLLEFFEGFERVPTRRALEAAALTSSTAAGIRYPSAKYTYDGLLASLRVMTPEGIASGGRIFQFYTSNRYDFGGVNLALFLAMVMTETVAHDACDESNTDEVAGKFALSNAW